MDRSKARVKVRIFEERYSGGVLDMNIFCFLIVNENDDNSISRSGVVNNDSLNIANMQ